MNMPGFTAEASLYKTICHYEMVEVNSSTMQTKILPQQIFGVPIPPWLECLFNYWGCNSYCSSLPLSRRFDCYSYCFAFYNVCVGKFSIPVR